MKPGTVTKICYRFPVNRKFFNLFTGRRFLPPPDHRCFRRFVLLVLLHPLRFPSPLTFFTTPNNNKIHSPALYPGAPWWATTFNKIAVESLPVHTGPKQPPLPGPPLPALSSPW